MRYWFLCCALAVAATVAGCGKKAATASAPNAATAPIVSPGQYHLDHAQPKLPTLKIWVGPREIDAELAVTIPQIATGMMFRTNMTDSEAMLFVFGLPQPRGFYMKNCIVPLSVAYIDANGVIDEIVDLHPGITTPVLSRSDLIKYVLEVPQGWFLRNQVSTGTSITTARGPLKGLSGILE